MLVEALRPHLNMPLAFFGHSMGALLSFEIARQLRRDRDRGPLHLFVSGHRAPQLPNPDPHIHALPEPEFIEELRRFSGTPEIVLQQAELMELLLPALRADFSMTETYVYSAEEPLDAGITAFGGGQDPKVRPDELLPWREQTRSSFTIRVFPGDHFFLLSARTHILQALSEELTLLLSQIRKG
jgi:medium-chain acyl-[acyl-carrier-protein] hydrolase